MTGTAERTGGRLRAARAARRPPRLGATVLALGIIFALAYVFVLRTPPQAPSPEVRGVRGVYAWQAQARGPSGMPRETGSFSAVASGDAGGQSTLQNTAPRAGAYGQARSAYDAVRRAETTVGSTTTAVGAKNVRTRTVGAWPPMWHVATRSPLDYQGLAAIVRSAIEDGDRTVGFKPLKDGDRMVWRAAMTIDGAEVELVIDQLTGIVLWYADGRSTFTATVDWSSPPPPGQTYAVGAAPGTTVATRIDGAYAYASSVAAAGRAAGYAPLTSSLAPDGFTLKAVAAADAMGAPGAWLAGGRGRLLLDRLAGQRQVAQLYARGLSWFTVRQLGPTAAGESVALLRGTLRSLAADKLSFQTTTLQYGAFAGKIASTWYERSGPTLLVSDARHVVYVTGALTRQELISFAEGLETPGGGTQGSSSPTP